MWRNEISIYFRSASSTGPVYSSAPGVVVSTGLSVLTSGLAEVGLGGRVGRVRGPPGLPVPGEPPDGGLLKLE